MSDIYKNTLLIMFLVLALTDIKINKQEHIGAKNTKEEIGVASWYNVKSSSSRTASGERFLETAFTGASNDYPFNTLLKVTNLENGKSVIVRVNDRGGFKKYGRIIDLSKGAFAKIADLKRGIITVKITKIK
jgi:rare lipoprotein A